MHVDIIRVSESNETLAEKRKNKSFSGYTRIHYKLTLIPIHFAVNGPWWFKVSMKKWSKIHSGKGNKLFITIRHQSVINSFIKHRVNLHSEVGKIPFQFWNTHRVSRTYVAWSGKVPFGQRGGPSLHRRVLYVAHAWADGELINIKCAMFVD